MISSEGAGEAAAWADEFLTLVKSDREQGLIHATEAYKQVSTHVGTFMNSFLGQCDLKICITVSNTHC